MSISYPAFKQFVVLMKALMKRKDQKKAKKISRHGIAFRGNNNEENF